MRKVEEKGYGDEIIDAGDIFCNYGKIGRAHVNSSHNVASRMPSSA